MNQPSRVRYLADRLLAVPLTAKLLVANGALALLWAGATALALGHHDAVLDGLGWPPLALATTLGIAVSVGANALVLQSALAPLRGLARVAEAVERGDRSARARPGRVRDPQTDRLIALTNRMLDALEAQRRATEASAAELEALSKGELRAREDERRRLARELLDDVAQSCAAINLGLEALARGCASGADHTAVRRQVDDLQGLVRGVIGVVERAAVGLRPAALDELGLVPALQSAAGRWRDALGVEVAVLAGPLPLLAPAEEVALFRVAEEAVANAARHARAGRVELRLGQRGEALELCVVDDGVGFDAAGAERGSGLGILRMRGQLALVGGRLIVESAPGAGTTVRSLLPLATRSS